MRANNIETMSKSKVYEFINRVDETLEQSCIGMFSGIFEQFLENVSKVWEDKNAVKFADDSSTYFQEIIKETNKRNKDLVELVITYARYYLTAGGMEDSLNIEAKQFHRELNIKSIQPFFIDPETNEPDTFGFKDATYAQVADLIMDFKTTYQKIRQNTITFHQELTSIHAFGNQDIQKNISNMAQLIVDKMVEQLQEIEKDFEEKLKATVDNYRKIGIDLSQ